MGQFSKRWEDLDFSDNFIFCKVMKNERICKKMLKILLDLDVEKIEYMNTEQQLENLYDSKGIRMDLFIKGSDKIIDLEMQTGNYEDLLLRSRYYQASADVSTVPRHTKYRDLKELYIVFICKEDPFSKGFAKYTKKMSFEEDEALRYDDKTHTVFYNCSAYKKAETKEVQGVLEFIYNLQASSDFAKELKDEYITAKQQAGARNEYMYFSDILEEEKEEARATGLAEGKAEGIKENLELIARKMLQEKCDIELIMKITNLDKEKILELE